MNLDWLASVSLVCAAIPCGLFLANLRVYLPVPPKRLSGKIGVSVLVPARDEEINIRESVAAALANRSPDLEVEVIVIDDHSSDRTVEIVAKMARMDGRLRLERAPPLPLGWCGKQHACHVLASLARHPLLVFIDADVRLANDALERLAGHMNGTGVDLASGIPRQRTESFSERLLIPLIHFILLGFLPMRAMSKSRSPAYAAGCGQLFVTWAASYRACGGHAMLRGSMHDGIKLPRVYRKAGLATGLFDATDMAVCRMYRVGAEVWSGLGKNATEGLAAPGAILPMTTILGGGQVLPFVLLFFAAKLSRFGLCASTAAAMLSLLPRMLAVPLFRQPLGAAFIHPVGVVALLGIQWFAFARRLTGHRAVWKARAYRTNTC